MKQVFLVISVLFVLLFALTAIAADKVVVIPLGTKSATNAIWHGFCAFPITMGSAPQTYCLSSTYSPNVDQPNGYFTVNKNNNNAIDIYKKGLYQIVFSAMNSYMCHIYLYRQYGPAPQDISLLQRSGAGPFTNDTMAIASGSINYILDGNPGDKLIFKIHTDTSASKSHSSGVGVYSSVTIIKIK